MNSSVKALIEAMISNLKKTQDATQHQLKQVGEKTLTSSTPDGKTCMELPVASLSPWKKNMDGKRGMVVARLARKYRSAFARTLNPNIKPAAKR